MSRRAQRWLFGILAAAVAWQIYVVREWIAALLLVGVVFAGVAVVGVIALAVATAWLWMKTNAAAAWQAGRSVMSVAATYLAKLGVAKTLLAKTELVDSSTSQEDPVLWI